ncbi:CorA metal ion transporter [Coemansia sp. IMI 209127]|nr:CorA metal ion transporter [Coemansia sp. IMI 209127]
MNPTDGEITALSRIFNLHPLTTEELLMMREHGQAQDNFKSFRHYDVICYRTSMGTLLAPEASAGASTANVDAVPRDTDDTMGGNDGGDAYGTGASHRAKQAPRKRKSFVRDISHRVQPQWDSSIQSQDEKHLSEVPAAAPAIQGDILSRFGLRKLGSLLSRKPRASRNRAPIRQDGSLHTQVDMQHDFPGSFGDDALDEPAPLYVIVLADGILTLHYHSVPHVRNTVARLKLDEDLVRITPDYIAYLLLDDITDTLVPTTRLLELEVDAIDELVLILTRAEHDDVLKRIGIERRHALWLVRLMHGKAEVLRAIERRVQAKLAALDPSATTARSAGKRRMRNLPQAGDAENLDDGGRSFMFEYADDAESDGDALESQLLTSDEEEGDLYDWARKTPGDGMTQKQQQQQQQKSLTPDVTKYLADVHDHLIALTASVHHCERILARAHGNYLARINLELTHASNTTNQLATQMTVLAGIFLPLNLVAGIFGMNVKVPGRDRDDLRDFGLILGAMAIFVAVSLAVCRWRHII